MFLPLTPTASLVTISPSYIQDTRIHCCLFFIQPSGHSLKPIDILVLKKLSDVVNVVPVIAKADTLTQNDLYTFKQRIRQVIQAQGIRIYQPPIEMDDEVSAEHARVLSEAMPFSIIGSTEDVTETRFASAVALSDSAPFDGGGVVVIRSSDVYAR